MSISKERNYSEWQERLITQFQFNLLNIALKGNFESIFSKNSLFTPIQILEVPHPLKDILLRFNAETLHDIINGFKYQDFAEGNTFRDIMDFQAVWETELSGVNY